MSRLYIGDVLEVVIDKYQNKGYLIYLAKHIPIGFKMFGLYAIHPTIHGCNINEIKNKKNIIDIRTRFEFNEFNIGGRNITRINLLRNPEYYLDKNNTYYIVCNKGTESLSCTKILNALGYNCYSVAGGIDDLKKL